MKLKVYNKANSGHVHQGKPTVNIGKNGMFSFSKTAADLMGLDLGGSIDLIQDEDNPTDWYIRVSQSNDSFTLRGKQDKKETSLMIASSINAIRIKKALGLEDVEGSIRFLIAGKPTEYEDMKLWAILTKNPTYKEA